MSGRFVSLTYCIHARAIAASGSQPAFRGSPENFEAGRASDPVGRASQTSPAGMAFRGSPGRLRQSGGEAGVEPGDREIALISTLVAGERIDGHADEPAPGANFAEEGLVRGPDSGESVVLDRDAFLRAEVAHHRHLERRIGKGVRLDRGPIRVRLQLGHARAEPRRRDAFGVHHDHPPRPVTSAAVTPERPGDFGQLGMPRLRPQVDQGPQERRVRTVARVAPHLAVGLLGLLVGGSQQRTIMLLRQGLPVEVVRSREPRLARPLAAAVLVHDHPAQGLQVTRNPDGVVDAVDELAGLLRGFIPHAVVRGIGRREDVVRSLLGMERGVGRDQEQQQWTGTDHQAARRGDSSWAMVPGRAVERGGMTRF